MTKMYLKGSIKQMKKINLSLLFCLITALILSFSVYAAEVPSVMSNEEINVIKLLEIANGDTEGNMNYQKPVTRAEFIKMTVFASQYKDLAVSSKINTSVFPDVRNTHWAAGYISIAVDNGLVNGYLDGTFKPDNPVTLEEAATIVLRLLGYTASDLGTKYPDVQISKYKDLELDEKMTAVIGKKLTREECMLLIYNALNAKTKSGSVYCTVLGYNTNSEGKIDYSALLKNELEGPYIISDTTQTIKENTFSENKKTVYQINNTAAVRDSIKNGDVFYYSDVLNCVFVYRKTATGIISATTGTSVTIGNHTYTISTAAASEKLSLGGAFSKEKEFVTLILGLDDGVIDVIDGDISLIDSNEDNASYTDMINATLSIPYLANTTDKRNNWKDEIPFNPDEASIYINGKKVVTYSVDVYDVIYYSKQFNSIWIYRDSYTGIIQGASVGQTGSTVSVGSKSFSVVTNEAKYKISQFGSYGDGDYVTLILGKNSEVIDIIDGNSNFKNSDSDDQSFIDMIEDTISSPIYIETEKALDTWENEIPFDINEGTVYVSGRESTNYIVKVGDVLYYSEPFKSVWIFRETQSGILTSTSANSVSLGTKVYALATDDAKLKVSAYGIYRTDDYVTLVLGKNDEVVDIRDANTSGIGTSDNDSSYSEVVSSTLKGPYVVAGDGSMSNLGIDIENSTIFYLGNETDSSVVNPYDVYYYSEVLNTVWIYRNKVSGTIESVSPATSPTTVVLSGNTYKIDNSQASYDLSDFGIYDVGDRVTLLLGIDDVVAGVVSTEISSSIVYGVITDKGEKDYVDKNGDKYTANYITVTDTSAKKHTYEYKNNKYSVGDPVRVSVGNSISVSKISTDIGKGEAAALVNAFKNGLFSDGCNIIDVSGSDVIKVFPSRLTGIELDVDAFNYTTIVLYYDMDEDGMITDLILDDFTGDIDKYGIVVSSNNTVINYMTDNVERSLTTQGSTCSSGPAKISIENGVASYASPLLLEIDDIDNITSDAVYDEEDNEYLVSDDVSVYIKSTNTTYSYADISDISADEYIIKAYCDKLPKYGGRVRVIIATKRY